MWNIKWILVVLLALLAVLAVLTNHATTMPSADLRLGLGERMQGDVIILSGNVELAPGSALAGSLYVVCCNVAVGGEVAGSVYLLTGNLDVQQTAVIRRNIAVGSANVQRSSSAIVEGSRTSLGSGFWLRLARAFCLVPLIVSVGVMSCLQWLWRRRRSTDPHSAMASDG